MGRVAEAVAQGTTYLETKTGYGLDIENEARSARIASTVVDEVTYLGAHLVPAGMDAEEYTELVCGPMLSAVRPFVRWADVSANGAPSPRPSPAACSRPAGTPDWGCGCTATSSAWAPASGWRWNSAQRAWTT